MALRLRRPLLQVPRPFSSSSSSNNNNNPPFPLHPPPPPSDDPGASPHHPPPNHGEAPHAPAPSLFSDIRDRLQSSPAPPPPRRIPNNPFRPAGPSVHIDDIKRSLESFRSNSSRLSAPDGGVTPSFQDLLKTARPAGAPNAGDGKSFAMDLGSIRRSLRDNHRHQQQQQRQRPPSSMFLTNPPESFLMKERAGKPQPDQGKEEADAGIFFTKQYSHEELGKKLAQLRPAEAGKDGKEWFSLEELQGRIAKLAELERSQQGPQHGVEFGLIRQSLTAIQNEQQKRVKTVQGISLFANIGGKPQPDYMLNNLPPQEELLERYFHPDHMSGEEKMKLELQKVRDEFKMSENDCGSARVQIAQLTLKIKHLSSVLHKKDKHSRKGLQDMVQRRKKYLKYLRRTDWDSYCLVLSKLGLRDTPEYKAPDYKKTQPTKAQSKKSKSKRKRKMKA